METDEFAGVYLEILKEARERNAIGGNLPDMIPTPLGKIIKHLNVLTIHWPVRESTLGGWSTVVHVESCVK